MQAHLSGPGSQPRVGKGGCTIIILRHSLRPGSRSWVRSLLLLFIIIIIPKSMRGILARIKGVPALRHALRRAWDFIANLLLKGVPALRPALLRGWPSIVNILLIYY